MSLPASVAPRVLLESFESIGLTLSNSNNNVHARAILAAPLQIENETMPPDLAYAIEVLWADEGTQKAFSRSNEIQLNDSAEL